MFTTYQTPASYLTNKYNPVDSIKLAEHFESNGFKLHKGSVATLRKPVDPTLNKLFASYSQDVQLNLITQYNKKIDRYHARLGHEKHFLSFKSDTLNVKAKGHNMFLRISNSHDGTSSLRGSLDILRLVCLNGMVAPRQIFSFSIPHNRKTILADAIEASYKIISQKDLIDEQIDRMSSKVLTQDEKILLVDKMVEFRYGEGHDLVLDPSKKLELIKPTRIEEKDDNLYQNFNTLQEKLTRGSRIQLLDATGKPIDMKVRELKSQVTADSFNNDSWNFAYSLVA